MKKRIKRGINNLYTLEELKLIQDSRPFGSLEELKNQPRNELPKVKAYPFGLLVKSGVIIPYTEPEQEITGFLKGDMMQFEAGIIALVWKNSEESFWLICNELKNKDYYRRKCALEYLEYHSLFIKNISILGFTVLDHHEIVVKTTLNKIIHYGVKGLQDEVAMAMEVWPDNKEIKRLCCIILTGYGVDCSQILETMKNEEELLNRTDKIYENSSQRIVLERMNNSQHYSEYLRIISRYYPEYENYQIEKLIRDLADEGCGYASLATTLVQYFADDETAFFKSFGFPIKNETGYVIDKLMLDFYCMQDEAGRGMYFEDMQKRFWKYCYHYGLNVRLKAIKGMKPDEYKEYIKSGYILIYAGDFSMHATRVKPTYIKGWHVMNVCNIEENGIMTVVSWGKKYTMHESLIRGIGWHYIYVEYIK